MNNIEQLQAWYGNHCDGDWEHQYGISIENLDNPGWSFKVELNKTNLEHKVFSNLKFDRSETDWVVARKCDGVFECYGGVNNLNEMIGIFLEWTE